MKFCSIVMASILASGALFAADFSKSSNADLLNMAGKVKATDAKDFFSEIDKRVDEMTGKEAREFWEKYRANEEKVFDSMKVKDIRAYKQSLAGARGDVPFGKGDFGKGKKGAHKHGKGFEPCPCGAPNGAPHAPKGNAPKK